MSKVICEICGTAFPETADQCPICGCAKGENARIVADDTQQEKSGEEIRAYVRGGRFSKSNVRKRNKAAVAAAKTTGIPEPDEPRKGGSNKGLMIAALVLLLAIVAMIGFIVIRYFDPFGGDGQKQTDSPMTTTTAPEHAAPKTIPCTELKVSSSVVELEAVNEAWLLNVTLMPADTTDQVTYESSDDTIATVSDKGRITAVGPGQAVITITCGEQEVKCRVVCNFAGETTAEQTDPSETTAPTEVDDPTTGDEGLKLNREDITMSKKGETWQLYSGSLGLNQITWTSDDETIATIEGGKVTAVGPGMTKVYGEYNGTKVSCIIRCVFPAEGDNGGEGTGGEGTGASCTISHTDVTIKVGESFKLTLKDRDGNVLDVTWTSPDLSICTVSGNTVKGAAPGRVTVSTTYGGETYSCIVRVVAE